MTPEDRKKKIDERNKYLQERNSSDYQKILKMPEGRRQLYRILEDCGVFQVSFTGNSETFFREGKRSIGLLILADIMEAEPEKLLQMQNEYRSEKVSFKKQFPIEEDEI